MTQEEMTVLVPQKLREIEQKYRVTVLYAAESGSRAWGFASPDSDFDVRFIYKRPREDYLRLDPPRDVIELPVDDTWDVVGWDLDKTLRLLHKSNPGLYEWLGSPVCYLDTGFSARIAPLMQSSFSERKMLWHYLGMARVNKLRNLRGETVRPKKYLYVLRPLLACRWILDRHCAPPVPFSALAAAELPDALREAVAELLEQKIQGPEALEIPHMKSLDAWIEQTEGELPALLEQIGEEEKSWQPLNDFFLSELQR